MHKKDKYNGSGCLDMTAYLALRNIAREERMIKKSSTHKVNSDNKIDWSKKMKTNFSSFDDLPITISADEVAMVLGISRANAYSLMHTKGFPTIYLGRRMIVPKDKFIEWINQQVAVG